MNTVGEMPVTVASPKTGFTLLPDLKKKVKANGGISGADEVIFDWDTGKGDSAIDKLYDHEWLGNRAMSGRGDIEDLENKVNMYSTSADLRFGDSTMGGSQAVNCRPQHTRYADLRSPGLLGRPEVTVENPWGNYGYGWSYSETMLDVNHKIWLRFGVPKFSGLLAFFRNFTSPVARSWAIDGVPPSIWRSMGNVVGYIGNFAVFGLTRLVTLNLVRYGLGAIGAINPKFYTVEPKMTMYWSMVSHLTNEIALNLGLFNHGPLEKDEQGDVRRLGAVSKVNNKQIKGLATALPHIMDSAGYISIIKVAGKYELYNRFTQDYIRKIYLDSGQKPKAFFRSTRDGATTLNSHDIANVEKFGGPSDYILNPNSFSLVAKTVGGIEKGFYTVLHNYSNLIGKAINSYSGVDDKEGGQKQGLTYKDIPSIAANTAMLMLDTFAGKIEGHSKSLDGTGQISIDGQPDEFGGFTRPFTHDSKGNFTGIPGDPNADFIQKLVKAEKTMGEYGLEYLVLEVDPPEGISDTFSNSTGTNPLQEAINGAATIGRSAKFSFAGGKLGVSPLDYIKDSVSDFALGGLDSFSWGVTNILENLWHGVEVDIPDNWVSSDASFHSNDYSLTLVSPYPNAFSQIQNIWFPLSCILAGALPIKVGDNTHVSPLLAQLFSPGENSIATGIIDKVTVERGITNLGHNKNNVPLSIKVTFSVLNLDKTVAAPMANPSLGLFGSFGITDDANLNRYIESLTGVPLELSRDHIFLSSRAKINYERYSRSWKDTKEHGIHRVADSLAFGRRSIVTSVRADGGGY